MAEDQSSRDILKQVVERLDLLERVLGTNTARLHNIERHVGIVPQPQPWNEPFPQRNGETHPATSQAETPDLNILEATQPGPVAPQVPESREQTWAQPEPQQPLAHHLPEPPEQEASQPDTPPPDPPATPPRTT